MADSGYDFVGFNMRPGHAVNDADGRTLLFVGTKRQAQDVIAEEAQRCGMYFINQRWLGGLLTNFTTIKHIALNLVRTAPGKDSMRLKRKVAAWDDAFLVSTITG